MYINLILKKMTYFLDHKSNKIIFIRYIKKNYDKFLDDLINISLNNINLNFFLRDK
jgi:hypothetical protein